MNGVTEGKNVQFTIPARGVVHALFENVADTAPEHTTKLVEEVARLSVWSPVVVLAQFAAGVVTVDVRAVQHWVQVAARPGVRLAGAGVITRSTLIRLAAQTVGLGTRVRGLGVSVNGFDDVAPALTWARGLVESPPEARR